MSHETPSAEHAATALDVAPTEHHAPEFDRREIAEFGKDDGVAVTAIGRMLVLFFFYSLIVMLCVGLWTFRAASHTPSAEHDAAHDSEEMEE